MAGGTRSVRTRPPNEPATGAFDARESAALFVGVRDYPKDSSVAEVRYAVDDAIDLAFTLALDAKVRLLEPSRVILALSGDPVKPESWNHFDALKAAGAQVRPAGHTDILDALQEQADTAGSNGILVLSFATHGVSDEGVQYLLTATSSLRHRETFLAEGRVREFASQSKAGRSLILIDACRERLRDDQRNGLPAAEAAAALLETMSGTHGQVVLSAAATGQYAYDDDVVRNGVFTAAVIAGLRCGAASDDRGFITAETLSAFVEKEVLAWIRLHRNPNVTRATQTMYEGEARRMPLAICGGTAPRIESGCRVSVASSPVGATVYVDNKEIGATPLAIGIAAEQRAKIVLVKNGYESSSTEAGCASGPIFITLTRRTGQPVELLRDPFDDNRNHWYASKEPEPPAGVDGGMYVLVSPEHQFRFTTVGVPFDPDQDFQIAVTARRRGGSRQNFFGLIWGVADEKSMYFMAINGQGNVQIGQMENWRGTDLNDRNAVNRAVRTDDANRLKIAKVGTRMRFFVNDEIVHEMEFRPFFGPSVGLGAFAPYDGTASAAFDDFTVEGSVVQERN